MTFSFAVLSVPLATLLTYVPHFARVTLQQAQQKYDNTAPRAPLPPSGLLHRLNCAHVNQLETLGLFAAGVAASVARGKGESLNDAFAAWYLAARAAYVVAYAAPQVAGGGARSLAFGASLAAIMSIWIRAAL